MRRSTTCTVYMYVLVRTYLVQFFRIHTLTLFQKTIPKMVFFVVYKEKWPPNIYNVQSMNMAQVHT